MHFRWFLVRNALTIIFCSQIHRQVRRGGPTGLSAVPTVSSVQRQGVHGALVQE